MINTYTIEALPIVIENHSFVCNEQRMWNLNEIHRVLCLPDTKSPSQWNNKIHEALTASGNFQKVDKVGTWATEKGTIAYAMWVSPRFYEMVVDAFIFMRNDAVLRERVAVLQADEANAALSIAAPKASIFDNRLANGRSVPWSWACKSLGLAPFKLRNHLKRTGRFCLPPFTEHKHPYPTKKGFELGYFVWKKVMDRNEWQVTARGVAWMQEKQHEWREAIATNDRRKTAAKRAAKSGRKVVV